MNHQSGTPGPKESGLDKPDLGIDNRDLEKIVDSWFADAPEGEDSVTYYDWAETGIIEEENASTDEPTEEMPGNMPRDHHFAFSFQSGLTSSPSQPHHNHHPSTLIPQSTNNNGEPSSSSYFSPQSSSNRSTGRKRRRVQNAMSIPSDSDTYDEWVEEEEDDSEIFSSSHIRQIDLTNMPNNTPTHIRMHHAPTTTIAGPSNPPPPHTPRTNREGTTTNPITITPTPRRPAPIRAPTPKPHPTGPIRLADLKCVICLSRMEDMTALTCGHLFCHDCISQAIVAGEQSTEEGKGRCPICRKTINRPGGGRSRRAGAVDMVPMEVMKKKPLDNGITKVEDLANL
ncbi:MAG: SUMO-targeted ubiquitin ligase complex subunit slx8 [Cirrosporium novae-zelandiae]|nr:MAG: SUMO-targeted ubiquitin ligase complex subunit slx8 [Cirrosporium novae-zelandiae]